MTSSGQKCTLSCSLLTLPECWLPQIQVHTEQRDLEWGRRCRQIGKGGMHMHLCLFLVLYQQCSRLTSGWLRELYGMLEDQTWVSHNSIALPTVLLLQPQEEHVAQSWYIELGMDPLFASCIAQWSAQNLQSFISKVGRRMRLKIPSEDGERRAPEKSWRLGGE